MLTYDYNDKNNNNKTEGLIIVAQNQSLPTKNFQVNIKTESIQCVNFAIQTDRKIKFCRPDLVVNEKHGFKLIRPCQLLITHERK